MTALINTFSGMENVVVVVNVKQHDDLEDPGADWYSDDPETVATKLNLNPLYPTLKDTKGIVLHKGFALEYDDTHEQPRWVFYCLTKEQAKAKRNLTNDFRPDPDVFRGSATLEDYLESGYYRGQLCPPTDMAWDASCMSETFLRSNTSPMDKKFRNSIWADCEKTINKWAQKHDSLYVVSGPVLRLGLNTIGASCVSVPEYFYKVVYDPARLQGIAVLVPNQKSSQAMKKFVVTIDSVEAVTGIDFFPSLPAEVEQKVEGVSNFKNW